MTQLVDLAMLAGLAMGLGLSGAAIGLMQMWGVR